VRKRRRNKLTINSDQIEKAILEKAGDHKDAIERVVIAGMKILFSDATHNQLFDSLRKDLPLADQLGASAVHIMLIMFQQSKGTMPGEAMIPAGTILLAKAVEYIAKTKMFPVNDAIYMEAVQIFIAGLKHEIGKQAGNSSPPAPTDPAAAPNTQAPINPPGPINAPPGGMLQGVQNG